MTPTTLVDGGRPADREAAIAAALRAAPQQPAAAILEGMPDGNSPLGELETHGVLRLIRIAPGCPCCIGNLTMRVMLNRLLRNPPQHLYVALATTGHLAQVRQFLSEPPYSELLALQPDRLV